MKPLRFLAALFLTSILYLLGQQTAYAEEPTADQQSIPPVPPVDGATVTTSPLPDGTLVVTNPPADSPTLLETIVTSIQDKINTATITVENAVSGAETAVAALLPTQEMAQAVASNPEVVQSVTTATDKLEEAQVAIIAAETATAAIPVAQGVVDSATAVVEDKTAVVLLAQAEADSAVADNQVAEAALNEHTPIVIAAQEANDAARDANDVAQAAVAPANQAVADQQVIVYADVEAVNAAQVAITATAVQGLNETVYASYQGGGQPAVGYGSVRQTIVDTNGINEQWGSGGPAGLGDSFQVKWEGNITSPTTTNIQFYAPADDGVKLYIDNTLVINDWVDKGGGGSLSAPIAFTANTPKPITLWFYENGGGANVALYWYAQGTSGYRLVPSSAFTRGQVDPTLQAALDAATGTLQVDQATLNTLIAAANAAQQNANAAYQTYMDANNYMMVQEGIQAPIQQAAWDTRAAVEATSIALVSAQQDLADAQVVLTSSQDSFTVVVNTANQLADTAVVKALEAKSALETATTTVSIAANLYTAEQLRLQAQRDAEAASLLAAQKAAAAEAARLAAEASAIDWAPAPQPPLPPEPVADPSPEQPTEQPPVEEPDAPVVAPEEPAPAPQEPETPPSEVETPTPEPDPAPIPPDEIAPEAPQENTDVPVSDVPSPETPIPGLEPNNPDQLPDSIPKLPEPEALKPHVQEDKAGVENGGIEFFGTKTAPQVIGEDGKLTPPPPAPGSGLPIDPEAITIADTFIGQPGGTTFNAPDVAVPVELTYVCTTIDKDGVQVHVDLDGNEHPIEQCTFLPAALDAIPGAGEAIQAVGAAYAALANIGNDMSPITRKKAKKILVITTVIAAVRRRFGS